MNIILIIQLAILLAVALFVLTRASDIFIECASKLGEYFGISPFVIGVLIVGMGTSLPELATSIAAVLDGTTEIVIANAVGSNITNILLIVGVLAFWGGRVVIKQDLIKTELPIFFIATVHFTAIMFDGRVDRIEGWLLLGTFSAYLWYLLVESQSDRYSVSKQQTLLSIPESKKVFPLWEIVLGAVSLATILVAASYAVTSVVKIAAELSVPIGFISITAVAIGTSLPELFVTLRAIKSRQTEMAIGNIFGSNAFNMLVVVGLPAIISPLLAGEVVMNVGLGIMLAASAIFFVSGLARQIMRWEGLMMLIFFVFFLVKLMAFV
jgi:cation:H+ antiporter